MKTVITTFVCALTLSTTLTFGNTLDKTKVTSKTSLPAEAAVLETPAPQNHKTVNDYTKYTPVQKASIVELKLAK